MARVYSGNEGIMSIKHIIVFSAIVSTAINSIYGQGILEIAKAENNQFPNPQSAIRYFIDSISDNRISDSLKAFCIDDSANNFNFDKYCENLGFVLLRNSNLPTEYKELNKLRNLDIALSTIQNIYINLFDINAGVAYAIRISSKQELQYIESKMKPDTLKDIEIIDMHEQKNDLQEASKINYEDDRKNDCDIYGADDSIIYVITLKLGNKFTKCSHLKILKYRENWLIFGGNFEPLK